VCHTMYSRVMEDQSRLLDFVPKSSNRATRKAKRALVKGFKEAFSCLAVGTAEKTAWLWRWRPSKLNWVWTGSRKMRLEVRQRKTRERWYWLGHGDPSNVVRWLRLLRLKRK